MNESLRKTLKKLRLSGLAESLDVRLQEAAGHSLNHNEFLELILQDELAVRADRSINRRIKAASFREPMKQHQRRLRNQRTPPKKKLQQRRNELYRSRHHWPVLTCL